MQPPDDFIMPTTSFWQSLRPAGAVAEAPAPPYRYSYPARLPDGRVLDLPLRRSASDPDSAVASFIANHASYEEAWKRRKIDDIVLMLRGAMVAEGKVGQMMNVPRDSLQQVLSLLPAVQQPTVSSLADERWVDVNTILDESIVRNIIPRLKSAGARGIVEYALTKIIE